MFLPHPQLAIASEAVITPATAIALEAQITPDEVVREPGFGKPWLILDIWDVVRVVRPTPEPRHVQAGQDRGTQGILEMRQIEED